MLELKHTQLRVKFLVFVLNALLVCELVGIWSVSSEKKYNFYFLKFSYWVLPYVWALLTSVRTQNNMQVC